MADAPDPDMTQKTAIGGKVAFGRYTLDRIIGRGGMGVVWLGKDDKLELPVALKYLPDEVRSDPDALRDLRRETKRALRLTHENIVRVYTLEEDASSAAIVMEYIDGQSMSGWKASREEGCVDVGKLAPLVQQLCAALAYAHATAGIVHRDLKPGNLLVAKDGTLKVADFGIARSLQETHTRLTGNANTTSGTLLFMSPQQMLGEKATPLDDIYSLGATLYDLISGKPPFFTGDVFQQVRNSAPISMTKRREELENKGAPIPQEWEDTIRACLEKDPAKRPHTALEVAARLNLAGGEMQLPKEPVGDETVVIPIGGEGGPPSLPRNSTKHNTVKTPPAPPPISPPPPVPPHDSGRKIPVIAHEFSPKKPIWQQRGAQIAAAVVVLLLILALVLVPRGKKGAPTKEEAVVTPGKMPEGRAREFLVTVDPIDAGARLWLGPKADVVVPPDGRALLKDLPDGEFELRVEAMGYQPLTTRVNVAGGRGSLEVKLVSLKGTLEIVGRDGSSVTAINAQGKPFKLGTIPPAGTLTSENLLTLGKYTVQVTHPDCSPFEAPVDLVVARTARVEAAQLPLPGELRVFSVPTGAELSINGIKRGVTPATLPTEPSEKPLQVDVYAPGYRRVSQTITLKPRDVRKVDVGTMVAESGQITLRFLTADLRTDRAKLLIDGKSADAGRAWGAGPLTIDGIDIGDHTVEIVHPDYLPWKQTASVRDQQAAFIDVRLSPKPGRLMVKANPRDSVFTVNGRPVKMDGNGVELPAGEALALRVSALGYKTASRTLTLAANSMQNWDVSLEKVRGVDPGQPWTIPDLELTLMPIAPGTFVLGSDQSRNERPVTRVTLTQPFWLGKTEVRQKEWMAVMGTNPSKFKGDNRPVETVTWTDAMEFCRRLTERERSAGRLTGDYVYTLPTEAQWEYAARAGSSGNEGGYIDESAWNDENSGKVTHDVGTKRANAWGLHDMLGNVWEWCADFYGKYPGGAVNDYVGVSSSSERIFRGGSWDESPKDCRFAVRKAEKPGEHEAILGFRVALARVR